MAYQSFRELRVYQAARKLAVSIYEISGNGTLARDFGLRDQIRRAAVSIGANIAEGYERATDRDFIRFLYISKSSLSELQAHMDLAHDLRLIDETVYRSHDGQCESIKAMLIKLIQARRGLKGRRV